MASSPENPTENASVATEETIDDLMKVSVTADSVDDEHATSETISSEVAAAVLVETVDTQREYARTEEVPALLGNIVTSDSVEPVEPKQDVVEKADVPADEIVSEDETEEAHSATEPIQDPPETETVSAINIESSNSAEEHSALSADLIKIMETLQESFTATQYISAKIDAVSNDTDCLIQKFNTLSGKYDLMTAEIEATSSDSTAKNILSKTFLTVSSAIVALLAIFQVYTFIYMVKTQRHQNSAVSAVLGNMSSLSKKMAVYDKNITAALDKTSPPEHVQPNHPAAENTAHETAATPETASQIVTPILERLNRLRNGLPEKKLVRKETGDWFVYNKKNDECISDVVVVEALNQAYKKMGRSLSPGFPMPVHNALCLLKADGKGGTEIVMTKDFLPTK